MHIFFAVNEGVIEPGKIANAHALGVPFQPLGPVVRRIDVRERKNTAVMFGEREIQAPAVQHLGIRERLQKWPPANQFTVLNEIQSDDIGMLSDHLKAFIQSGVFVFLEPNPKETRSEREDRQQENSPGRHDGFTEARLREREQKEYHRYRRPTRCEIDRIHVFFRSEQYNQSQKNTDEEEFSIYQFPHLFPVRHYREPDPRSNACQNKRLGRSA